MLSRSLSIRQIGLVLLIFLFLFIILTLIESSKYLKCPSCSFLNISSTQKNFYEILNNTEDEKTSLDIYSIWCLDMAHYIDSEQRLPQSPILKSPLVNSSKLNRLPYRYSLWKSSSLIPRRLTACEHNLAMHLIMIIERICRKNKIPFMLSDGSLLGSWRHHDIIPWDDDIDLMIPDGDKFRFLKIIESMNETLIQHYVLTHKKGKLKYFKISFKNTPSAGDYSWNFPFIDIWFYTRNKTHLGVIGDPDVMIKLKYIFPLVMRPFGQLWLPAPRRPEKIFDFDPYDQCNGHFWDHRTERGLTQIKLNCSELKHIYPFVQRNNQSTSTEILKINNTIIHTVIYK